MKIGKSFEEAMSVGYDKEMFARFLASMDAKYMSRCQQRLSCCQNAYFVV